MSKKRSKKNKVLEDYMETDGKAEQDYEVTTLEQIWGSDGSSKFGTLSEETYSKKIEEMNKTDLQEEARRRGLVPVDDTTKLRARLMKEFKMHVGALLKPIRQKSDTGKMTPEVAKILAEGR